MDGGDTNKTFADKFGVRVVKIGNAIARAEGFYKPFSRPARNNNPGDFEFDVIGRGIGKDGPYIVYADINTGWEALYTQVEMMFNGKSHIYKSDMSIIEVARHWTEDIPVGSQISWAKNVADSLGVTVTTKLQDISE